MLVHDIPARGARENPLEKLFRNASAPQVGGGLTGPLRRRYRGHNEYSSVDYGEDRPITPLVRTLKTLGS